MFDIRKYLPGYIEVRSIYWQEIYLDINDLLGTISSCIDEFFEMEDAHNAMKLRSKIGWLIKIFEQKYVNNGIEYPNYIKNTIVVIHTMKHIMDIK